MPNLNRILLYPIKSLDGISVEHATILSSGALKYDREFAIVDNQDNFVNGKRTAKVHGIRTAFNLDERTVSLWVEGAAERATFHLDDERIWLERWFSHYFGFSVRLIQNVESGFPDDTNAPGPTLVSTETLQALTSWFPGLNLEEIRQRFRTNLEIAGGEPFWEDRLFGTSDKTMRFQVGTVEMAGINPCQRCIVVTRNSITGQAYPNFQKEFVTHRKAAMPEWSERSRFNHFYRLAVNTRIPSSETTKTLQIGDQITVPHPEQHQPNEEHDRGYDSNTSSIKPVT